MTEEGMMIQQAWREIPISERSRLVQLHNKRGVQEKLLRKNNRKNYLKTKFLKPKLNTKGSIQNIKSKR